MNWYQLTKEQVLEKLGVTKDGLSSKKAEELLQKTAKMFCRRESEKPLCKCFSVSLRICL